MLLICFEMINWLLFILRYSVIIHLSRVIIMNYILLGLGLGFGVGLLAYNHTSFIVIIIVSTCNLWTHSNKVLPINLPNSKESGQASFAQTKEPSGTPGEKVIYLFINQTQM